MAGCSKKQYAIMMGSGDEGQKLAAKMGSMEQEEFNKAFSELLQSDAATDITAKAEAEGDKPEKYRMEDDEDYGDFDPDDDSEWDEGEDEDTIEEYNEFDEDSYSLYNLTKDDVENKLREELDLSNLSDEDLEKAHSILAEMGVDNKLDRDFILSDVAKVGKGDGESEKQEGIDFTVKTEENLKKAVNTAFKNGQSPQQVLDTVSYDFDLESGSDDFNKLKEIVKSYNIEQSRDYLKRDWEKLQENPMIWAKEGWSDAYIKEVEEYGKSLGTDEDRDKEALESAIKNNRFSKQPNIEDYKINDELRKNLYDYEYYRQIEDFDKAIKSEQDWKQKAMNSRFHDQSDLDKYDRRISLLSDPRIQKYVNDRNAFNKQFENDFEEYKDTAKQALLDKLFGENDLYNRENEDWEITDDLYDSINQDFAKKYGYERNTYGDMFYPANRHFNNFLDEETREGKTRSRKYNKEKIISDLLNQGVINLSDLRKYLGK